jgi:hypothetical protein
MSIDNGGATLYWPFAHDFALPLSHTHTHTHTHTHSEHVNRDSLVEARSRGFAGEEEEDENDGGATVEDRSAVLSHLRFGADAVAVADGANEPLDDATLDAIVDRTRNGNEVLLPTIRGDKKSADTFDAEKQEFATRSLQGVTYERPKVTGLGGWVSSLSLSLSLSLSFGCLGGGDCLACLSSCLTVHPEPLHPPTDQPPSLQATSASSGRSSPRTSASGSHASRWWRARAPATAQGPSPCCAT